VKDGAEGRFDWVAGPYTLSVLSRKVIKKQSPLHGLIAGRGSPWDNLLDKFP